MESPSIGGRKRGTTKSSAEDQALDQIAKDAEARLQAKRQARAEAREIRLREIERQQKEAEENADRAFDVMSDTMKTVKISAAVPSPRALSLTLMSRRSSEDSLEGGETSQAYRDMRMELKELEEKFRKAMVQNAQLDNEKCTATYEVELLKDRLSSGLKS
uniref:Leucine-rich repeat flightless-interacting protein 2 n=1 Tax=Cacopsylla melanoneura TaxID=428564 RepID=A0A8D8S1D4_9HEMI